MRSEPSQGLGITGGVAGVVLFGSLQAILIILTAALFRIAEFPILPLIVVFCVLNSGRFPLFEGAISQGREAAAHLRDLRREYVEAVLEGAKVERFPKDPFRALAALGLVISKGAVRAWLILMVVAFVQVSLFNEPAPDVRPLWILLTLLEASMITARSMRNGTLALVGLSVDDMRSLMDQTLRNKRVNF